ncbi:Uncharacterised protein [Mycobacteroides abscessus subsp. abscessus]|nr:Uncharacterised protein [Mycobacteroides abscessus subsp. abscessus]
MKSAPTPPLVAQRCRLLHFPMSERLATAATVSRNATTTSVALARTNRPLRLASMPSGGIVEKTRPPSAGRVAMAAHGMETSSASGAPDTSGAVRSETFPLAFGACGHKMVAVVCLTGSSGVSAQSSRPARPAMIATRRAVLAGTRLKTRRQLYVAWATATECRGW